MRENEMSELQLLLEEAGQETRSYSGRGMFGKNCLGVTCGSLRRMFADVLEWMSNEPPDSLAKKLKVFAEGFKKACEDSMGRDAIVYFPGVPYVDVDADKIDAEACPNCGCLPGEGLSKDCDDMDGCGHWRRAELPDRSTDAATATGMYDLDDGGC